MKWLTRLRNWLRSPARIDSGRTALEIELVTLNPYTDPYACRQAMDSAADALAAQRAEIEALLSASVLVSR